MHRKEGCEVPRAAAILLSLLSLVMLLSLHARGQRAGNCFPRVTLVNQPPVSGRPVGCG